MINFPNKKCILNNISVVSSLKMVAFKHSTQKNDLNNEEDKNKIVVVWEIFQVNN